MAPECTDFAARLHFCYLGQKMIMQFYGYLSISCDDHIEQLGWFEAQMAHSALGVGEPVYNGDGTPP
jgi:hypothetical protein